MACFGHAGWIGPDQRAQFIRPRQAGQGALPHWRCIHWYSKNSNPFRSRVAPTLHEANDWSAVEALWRPYISQNDVEAQFRLAYYYLFYSFDEEPQTRAEMEKLLWTAAERDHPDAVYWLSHLYPNGTERDALLVKAGELGSLEGQRDLGALYATGDWTGPHDAVRAAEWYRRAAERGHPDAQYNLGFMYLLGEGVTSDAAEGLRWLRRAADQGGGTPAGRYSAAPQTSSGTANGARYPRVASCSRAFASSSPITRPVSGSHRSVRPSR